MAVAVGGRRRKDAQALGKHALPSASERERPGLPALTASASRGWDCACVPRGHQGWWRWGVGPPSIQVQDPLYSLKGRQCDFLHGFPGGASG